MYKRWLAEYEEVRKLEGKDIPVEEVKKIVLRKKKTIDLVNVSFSSSGL